MQACRKRAKEDSICDEGEEEEMSGREERNGIDLDDLLADGDYISWERDERGPQPEDFITDADRRQYDRYTDMQLQRASHFLARAWKDAGGRMNEEGDPATVIAFMDAAERMRVDPDVADRWLADTTGRRGYSVLREFADVARVPSPSERKNLYGYRASVAESGRRRAAMKDLDDGCPEMALLRGRLHEAQRKHAEAERTVSDTGAGTLAKTAAEAAMRRHRIAIDRILPRLARLENETGYEKEATVADIEERFCREFASSHEDIILGSTYGQKAIDRAKELCGEIEKLKRENMLFLAGKARLGRNGRKDRKRRPKKEERD